MRLLERVQTAYRAFVGGSQVVSPLEMSFGHDTSDYTPSEYGAYIATSNAVYTCAQRRARAIASLPIALYRGAGDKRKLVESGPLVELLSKVNPFWTMNRLMEMTELSLCLWGSCYWFLERGQSGRMPPREIWWTRPDRVRVVPHPENYISHFVYQSAHGEQELIFQPGEVIWLRYSNPIDQYSGLSPLAAARLSADASSAAMKSNRNLFVNGMQVGGFIMPEDKDLTYTKEQADQLESDLARRFKGVDKAHRWAVFRFQARLQSMNVTPKDAEFLGLLNWSLEDVARAYGVPVDLVGGERTYQNVREARRDFWSNTLLPECHFIASELTEQLLPMFPGHDIAEFDTDGVEELRVNENDEWTRAGDQILRGAITINEWRAEHGLAPVSWGDEPLQRAAPNMALEPAMPEEETEPPQRAVRGLTRAVEYGSPEHHRLFARFVRRTDPHEAAVARVVASLFTRQKDSILERLRAERGVRALPEDWLDDLWDMARWVKLFRTEIRPTLKKTAEDAGHDALDDLGLLISFDVANPAVVRFLEGRAQRFAEKVNETTWSALKESLSDGIGKGENMVELADRVEDVMADRIRSSKEVIARTEVIGAANGGTLEAWKQSDVVGTKTWLAALDDRVRDTHADAHGQTVALDADFIVGAGAGPAPGQIGIAEEDIQCRCSMTAGLK